MPKGAFICPEEGRRKKELGCSAWYGEAEHISRVKTATLWCQWSHLFVCCCKKTVNSTKIQVEWTTAERQRMPTRREWNGDAKSVSKRTEAKNRYLFTYRRMRRDQARDIRRRRRRGCSGASGGGGLRGLREGTNECGWRDNIRIHLTTTRILKVCPMDKE